MRLWVPVLFTLALSFPAQAEKPLSETPMEATPKQLLNLADARPVPAKAPREVLLDEVVWTIAEDGRVSQRYRYVVRITTQGAADAYRSVSRVWAPWHENKPEMAVRVIQPDGTSRSLDPALLTEAGVRTGSGAVFSDARILKGPLAPPPIGSVVEQVFTETEHKTFFEKGRVFRYPIGTGYVPTRLSRLIIDAPESMTITWRSHGLTVQPQVQKRGGRQRLTFEYLDPPVIEQYENWLPFNVHPEPAFEFSTAPDWASVARGYATLLQAPVATMNVKERADNIKASAGTDRVARMTAAFRQVQQIPYTSIAFGEGAIVPVAPSEIDRRGFADCKDKALLLVGLLRSLDIEADVALVRVGDDTDVNPELPGLDLFNHAVVKVKDGPWLDPTDEYTPYGEIPFSNQGRQALIIRPDTKSLTLIPPATPEKHAWTDTWDVYFGYPHGRATFTQRQDGAFGASFRNHWTGPTETQQLEYAKRVAEFWSGKSAGPASFADPKDLTVPMTATSSVVEAKSLSVMLGTTTVDLSVQDIAQVVYGFLPQDEDEEGKEKTDQQVREERAIDTDRSAVRERSRVSDLQLDPVFLQTVYRLHAPLGYTIVQTPDDAVYEGPGFRLQVTTTRDKNKPVEVRIAMTSTGERLSPAQAKETYATIDRWLKSEGYRASIAPTSSISVQEGRFSEAINGARADVAALPQDAWTHMLLADTLWDLGFAEPSFESAKRAVALAPNDAGLKNEAAVLDLHDTYGGLGAYRVRPNHPEVTLGWLRDGCSKSETADYACINLANALAKLPGGGYTPSASERNEAITVLAERRKRFGPGEPDQTWYDLLILQERWADLEAASAGATEDQGGPKLWKVVAIAGRKGLQPAMAEVRKQYPEPKVQAQVFSFLSNKFSELRRYDLAAAFLEQSASSSENPMQIREKARVLALTKRREDLKIPATSPLNVLLSAIEALVLDPTAMPDIHPLLMVEEQDGVFERSRSGPTQGQGRLQSVLDVFASADWAVEGDAKVGWKYTGPRHLNSMSTYFAPSDKGLKWIDASQDSPEMLGTYALAILPTDPVAARTWARWAYTGSNHACRALAPAGMDTADLATVGLYSACLASAIRPKLAEATLATAKLTDPNQTQVVAQARLAAAYREKNWERALAIYDQLPAASPERTKNPARRGELLLAAGRYAEAVQACELVLGQDPANIQAIQCKAHAQLFQGDPKGMEETFRAGILANPKDSAGLLNNLAWALPRDNPKGLEDARAAAELSKYRNETHLHTLAARLLYANDPDGAFEVLRQALKARSNATEPLGPHWEYIRAGLAEAWGMPDLARTLYAKVEPEKDARAAAIPYSTWGRAQERLRAMGAPKPASPSGTPRR